MPFAKKNRKRSFLVLGLLLLAFVVDLRFFAKNLLIEEPEKTPNVDIIAVLTGGQGRLKEAFALLKDGRGQYLFISGTFPATPLADILRVNGIEELSNDISQRIYLGVESTSTAENAMEVRKIVEQLEAKSVLLVTSNYHIQRATALLRRELKEAPELGGIEIIPFPVSSPNFNSNSWWESSTGWQILFSEYAKNWVLRLGL